MINKIQEALQEWIRAWTLQECTVHDHQSKWESSARRLYRDADIMNDQLTKFGMVGRDYNENASIIGPKEISGAWQFKQANVQKLKWTLKVQAMEDAGVSVEADGVPKNAQANQLQKWGSSFELVGGLLLREQ